MQEQQETAPAVGSIDPTAGVEAIASRIGSAHKDPDRIGTDATLEAAIAALPQEAQEIARRHPPRPIAERVADKVVATPEDWDELFQRLRAERASDWRSSVPREFAHASVDRLAADQQPEAIREWWSGQRTILVLRSARPGNGKTYSAYAVANKVCDQFWCVAYQLSDLVRDQIDRERTPDPAMWRRAVACELLILDDVGQESGVSWEREKARDVLHRLLSARNGAGRRTIMTTNRDGDWLSGKPDPQTGYSGGYGSAVLDRMAQNATVVEFTGESRRADSGPAHWGEL